MQTKYSRNLSGAGSETTGGAALVLDVGTTDVKAFVFDACEKVLARAAKSLQKSFPQKEWVEQDPFEIFDVSKKVLRAAVSESGVDVEDISAFGIANQRETTILWDRATGEPVYPAIVWEDKRTKAVCEHLAQEHGKMILGKTGLQVDSYFSASKIKWILDSVPDARVRAEKGELCFGTVDSWLLWNFADTHLHRTDVTNASRTLLFNIHTKQWDEELLSLFSIPHALLPEVQLSASDFGTLSPGLFGSGIPIRAIAGDQQASLFAAGHEIGTTKITFGTGIFIMQIVGEHFQTHPPLFTTLTADGNGEAHFAIEAKIEACAECVTPLIGHQPELDTLLDGFAAQVAHFVGELPIPPKELIIDGGVTQAPHLKVALERATGLPTREHAIFNGTALGAMRLIQDYLVEGHV